MPEWNHYDQLKRGLSPALVILNKVSAELDLPEHINKYSIRLYEILLTKKLTVGRKRESLIGACVYISCLGVNYPVNFNKLCKVLEIDKKELIRQKKFIKRFVVTNEQGITIENYINKYGFLLGLKQTDITNAIKLTKAVDKELINNTVPIKAAICLYLTVRNKVSIRDMARTTGLSRSGIFNAVNKLKDKRLIADLFFNDQKLMFLKTKKK